jgi:hypothetical protein
MVQNIEADIDEFVATRRLAWAPTLSAACRRHFNHNTFQFLIAGFRNGIRARTGERIAKVFGFRLDIQRGLEDVERVADHMNLDLARDDPHRDEKQVLPEGSL